MTVTLLTKVSQKRRRDGSLTFSCSGINPESMICRINTYNAVQTKNLELAGQTVIIRGCRVFNKDNVLYLQFDADTKVRTYFTNHCINSSDSGCTIRSGLRVGYIMRSLLLSRDFTWSHREGNWQLHFSAVHLHRALPVFCAFDKTNYSQWGTVPHKFPLVHADFLKGHFVMKYSNCKFSCVPMDQTVEQVYNKPAKGPSGIMGGHT